ncbi:MAG TPA: HD domain-containing phosphohydrolase [Thermoanaerobaculia bacterium]|nr:HD domain-containing phosphohydrolase [Thermoanaerobaculia bacterium]
MAGRSARRRIRLFVLLTGALILASLVPLVLSDAVLIRRNQRTLETLEEKYLTRSSSALADHVAAFYASARERLKSAAASLWLAGQLSGKDPFTSEDGPRLLGNFLSGRTPLVALRGFNATGSGRFVGPDVRSPEIDYEFRKGFESARDGAIYQGKPFWLPELGPVAVLALPVVEQSKNSRTGVVEALVSWQPIATEFRDEAHREVRVTLVDREGNVVFPLYARSQARQASLLVSDFMRFPARITRSETTPQGGAVLASIAPVGLPDWGVLVERDRDLAFASVDVMKRDTLIWSAVSLACALLLGILFARRLSDPIAKLASSTHAISEGDYGATVEVAGTAEIAELSVSFNRMSASIRTAFDQVQRAARENRELFLASIKALAEAIDAKDPYTRGHSERVAAYAATIASELDLPPSEVERIRLSALLHDVGKIGVDDRIIRKPTALSEEEFQLMKTHPIKGAAIMSAIPQLADVIPGMKYHHEKWSGGGYPEGLKGEEIPMQARIVTVADTFDAMTTTRPYQQAMEIEFVVERIRQFAGIRYDPRVVDAFVRAYRKGNLAPIPVRPALEEPELPELAEAL